jgi:predicted NUDIX family phosphoesterase
MNNTISAPDLPKPPGASETQMQNSAETESVLVVPRAVLEEVAPRTFSPETESAISRIVAHCRFLDRSRAERDFEFKQIIPYVVIRHREKYLLIRRTRKQTEARLHDMYSLGIGGHINDTDGLAGNAEIIALGMRRELTEEIQLENETSCEIVGIINDDSTEVARVHAGLVYLLSTSSPNYEIMEPGKYTASWKTPSEMLEQYAQMESWAQIVYDFVISCSAERAQKWK